MIIDRVEAAPALLLEFDLQTRIGLDVFDDLVIAGHEIGHCDAAAFGVEFPKLIEIERNELLDLENVNSVH